MDNAFLKLIQTDDKKIGTHEEVTLIATSMDPHSKERESCEEKFTVYFVEDGNFSIWETGIEPPKSLAFNYPGKLEIPLDNYALGPLIDYDIKNQKSEEVPVHWINKVN